MSAPVSRSSLVLVAFGSVAVLLLGAFSRSNQVESAILAPSPLPATVVVEQNDDPILPGPLSPGMEEIVKLAQAHVDGSVVMAFIRSSRQEYSPTADELLYLAHLGLSQGVLAALFKPKTAPLTAQNTEDSTPMAAAASVTIPTRTLPETLPANNAALYVTSMPSTGWMNSPDAAVCWQLATGVPDTDSAPSVIQNNVSVYVIGASPRVGRIFPGPGKQQKPFGTIAQSTNGHHHKSAPFSATPETRAGTPAEPVAHNMELARAAEPVSISASRTGR